MELERNGVCMYVCLSTGMDRQPRKAYSNRNPNPINWTIPSRYCFGTLRDGDGNADAPESTASWWSFLRFSRMVSPSFLGGYKKVKRGRERESLRASRGLSFYWLQSRLRNMTQAFVRLGVSIRNQSLVLWYHRTLVVVREQVG